MASLVEPLAVGFAAAPSGTAEFYRQGTSSLQDVYSDAEAVTAVTSHPLDSAGKLTRYVKGRTDVVVKNVSGATVATFTAGGDAREVRVENAGFTGTLANGTTGAGGRTTVDEVLTSLYASLGAVDGLVSVNGTPTTLSAAVGSSAGLVFNVKSYGAVGNDVANDFTAIGLALTAAQAAGGGIIFFPAGTYQINNGGTGYDLTGAGENYVFMGAAESAVTLKFYNNLVDGQIITGNGNVTFQDLTFAYSSSAFTGDGLINFGGTGRVTARSCTFGAFSGSWATALSTTAEFLAIGCSFNATTVGTYVSASTLPMRFVGCRFTSAVNGWNPFRGTTQFIFTACTLFHTGNSVTFFLTGQFAYLTGCLVDVSGATGTAVVAGAGATLIASGNRFRGGGSVTATLAASTATMSEAGNSFTSFGLGVPSGGLLLSQYRDSLLDDTTSTGITTTSSVTPNAAKGVYQIGIVAAALITVTVNAPSNDPGASAIGTRFSIILRNTGAAACTIAWNATYVGSAATVNSSDLQTSMPAGGYISTTFVRTSTDWKVVR